MAPPLKEQAQVAVVAPAGPLPRDSYAAGLTLIGARYALRQIHAVDAPPASDLPYLAASDAERAAALNQALGDDAVRAIFCARGGYGSARILDALDGEAMQRRALPLVGFSDITALHGWAARLGVPTLHGPVVNQLANLPQEDHDALFAALETGDPARFDGLQCLVAGRAEGRIVGGNLAVLASLCGTPYLPESRGAIFFFEDVNEPEYRLDRYLTQLGQAGFFAGIAGVVIGDLLGSAAAEPTLRSLLAPLGVPVATGLPCGHGGRNRAFWLGTRARLDAAAGTLEVEAPAR